MEKSVEIYFYTAEGIALQIVRETVLKVGEQQNEVVQVDAWLDVTENDKNISREFCTINYISNHQKPILVVNSNCPYSQCKLQNCYINKIIKKILKLMNNDSPRRALYASNNKRNIYLRRHFSSNYSPRCGAENYATA